VADLIKQIKARCPIGSFVAPYTRGLKSSGKGFMIGFCPFHKHSYKRPNFWVNLEKGICACFVPTCEAHDPPMDVINFYARLKGLTNQEAITELGKDFYSG